MGFPLLENTHPNIINQHVLTKISVKSKQQIKILPESKYVQAKGLIKKRGYWLCVRSEKSFSRSPPTTNKGLGLLVKEKLPKSNLVGSVCSSLQRIVYMQRNQDGGPRKKLC